MWVCVSTRYGTDAGSNGGAFQFSWRRSRGPWNMPLSTSSRSSPVSTRYCEPVTVRAAPRKVSRATNALLSGVLLDELAQHRRQDAAVAVVVDLHGRVEARDRGE